MGFTKHVYLTFPGFSSILRLVAHDMVSIPFTI